MEIKKYILKYKKHNIKKSKRKKYLKSKHKLVFRCEVLPSCHNMSCGLCIKQKALYQVCVTCGRVIERSGI